MFKTATSYLWGTNNLKSDKETTSSLASSSPIISHENTLSLPDLNNLHLEEKEHSPKHNNNNNNNNNDKQILPIDIILDINSKYKLSSTCNISFLFNEDENKNKNKKHKNNLIRNPYFIVSNGNINYINKIDYIFNNNDITDINVFDLNKYLDSLNLSVEEKKGILILCEWVKTEKLSIKLCNSILLSEIIITYFSSISPTNPDLFSCWKKWIIYRSDAVLSINNHINATKLKSFFDTGFFSIGFDNNRRPVWFVNTEYYDDSYGNDIITKACILWVSSLLWNIKKNQFDLFALRRGLSVYVNLSHWSINMASWNILQSVKKALVAFPFHLVDIYISNIPTFMYLLKQLAAKIVVPHAMEKLIILTDTNEYFQKYAPKHKTPICAGGTLKVSSTQWIKDRGFLHYINNNNKHNKSYSHTNII